ncbi:glycosyltransferase family 2 protein [Chitinophagaceae bacterium LB-8]|uniref:Glycosyltransferase family 2 protein n=1 Tax=Paraflavisolibacter caeni TaxID=2982496 RepID=A0A9X2XX49_9BACT|nr:glycosyltransferase family 2 protein [Paraflavisolibacter caeni]MCU7550351.1 glycosyltransferase family 2 protein [Paraflavisolibacter caeni]
MQLSIIIINYNTFQLTSNCIQSIQEKVQGLSYEIILVDNASKECDPQLFLEKFPHIILVVSHENTGFTGGNNLGLQHAKGDYVLLLNSDTELINNAPKICYDYMLQHPEAGMTTAQLHYPDGRIQYNCRKFRTISWEVMEVLPVYKFLPKEKQEKTMLHHYFDHQHFIKCDWVWGTFMMFPKKILKQLPGEKLADDFFMYCEDVLWCWDFQKLGYEIHFIPEAKVMHVHKGSSSKDKLMAVKKMGIKNHATFMKKFYPDWRWYMFAAIFYTKQYAALWLGKLLK